MDDFYLTRRRFAGLVAATAAAHTVDLHAATSRSSVSQSAAQLVQRISAGSGVTLSEQAVDGFKAGDPGIAVRGIAVTAMATMEVLQKAAAAKLNLVLSFEPTFFGRNEGQPPAANATGPGARSVAQDDPLLVAKRQFLQANGMVVYRLHDQWAERKENEHARALAGAMGWNRPMTVDSPAEYVIAPTSLAKIVAQTRTKLKVSGGLRVIGDPNAQIRRVTVLPGLQSLATLLVKLPATDLLLVGETRDWEGPEYVGDAVTAGLSKGLITVGKVVSADPGMRACATWLQGFIDEAPVRWLPAGEPYWRPA